MFALGNVTIVDSSISGRGIGTDGRGGSICTAGSLTSERTSVSSSASFSDGGGVYAVGSIAATYSNFTGNSIVASGSGAGIYAQGTVTLEHSKVHQNNARGSGAGIFAGGNVAVTTGSSIYFNQTVTVGQGGGIFTASNASIVNSMLILNNAIGPGGGLFVFGNAEIHNSTFYANSSSTAAGIGGGINVSGSATISNSVFHNSVSPTGSESENLYVGSGPLSLTFSLISNNAGTAIPEAPVGLPDASGNLIGGSINGIIDPQYTSIPLEDPSIYVLQPTSPAINTGDPNFQANNFSPPLLNDYRGSFFARVSGGRIDMGAFESGQNVSLVVDTLLFKDDLDYSNGMLSLLEAVHLSSQNPGLDTITFSPALFTGGPQVIYPSTTGLYLSDSTVILGPGRDLLTISSGFEASPTADLTIRALSLNGGGVGAGVLTIDDVHINGGAASGNDVIMQSCTVENSPSAGVTASYTLQVADSQIRGSAGHGIRMYLPNGSVREMTVEIIRSVIENNKSGGMYLWDYTENVNSTIAVRDSIVRGNEEDFQGSAAGIFAYVATAASVLITNTEISNNFFTGEWGVGGVHIFGGTPLSIYDSEIIGNTANGVGGVKADSLLAENCVFSNNLLLGSILFPGVAITSGDAELRNCVVANNSGGPAISCDTITAIGSTIRDNTNDSGIDAGGGIYANKVTLISSSLTGNYTRHSGGAIYAVEATILDSFIAGNTAGGSVSVTETEHGSNQLYVYEQGGGGIFIVGGQLLLENSIVRDNWQQDQVLGGVAYSYSWRQRRLKTAQLSETGRLRRQARFRLLRIRRSG